MIKWGAHTKLAQTIYFLVEIDGAQRRGTEIARYQPFACRLDSFASRAIIRLFGKCPASRINEITDDPARRHSPGSCQIGRSNGAAGRKRRLRESAQRDRQRIAGERFVRTPPNLIAPFCWREQSRGEPELTGLLDVRPCRLARASPLARATTS